MYSVVVSNEFLMFPIGDLVAGPLDHPMSCDLSPGDCIITPHYPYQLAQKCMYVPISKFMVSKVRPLHLIFR